VIPLDPALPLRGTVYSALLNRHDALASLGDAVNAPPYKAPPRAPVLGIKPRNTWSAHGQHVEVPAGHEAVQIGATLALVIGRIATAVPAAQALGHVAGVTVMNDLHLPHPNHFRPAMRFRCRDGFCPIGPRIVASDVPGDLDDLAIEVAIDGEVVQRSRTSGLIRSVAQLLADVSEFMTLHPGDVIGVGYPLPAPRARAGQRIAVTIAGIGTLETPLIAEGGA
jgi:5-oxopent-3-ene-1,2,5-tricarboxylate decarboxylase/2-hydroxyhepta-2,4-diene-1,7-dioate isomerase